MKHTFRGAVTAWMALIVLQAVGTKGGSGRIAGAFADANQLVQRALSPTVPAIPDRRNVQPAATPSSLGKAYGTAPAGSAARQFTQYTAENARQVLGAPHPV